jgi:pyridoxal phosphate enzyme (YggS family)
VGVAEGLAAVRAEIAAAARRVGRDPAGVTLIAVSKGFPADAVAAAAAAGVRDFGENRVQEAVAKMAGLTGPSGLRWHLIGRLQTNKVRMLRGRFTLLHALDRAELVDALQRRLAEEGRRLPVLMEVNVGGEASKAGPRPEEAASLARRILAADALELRGLMTVAPPVPVAEAARPYFAALRRLRDRLAEELGRPLPELSMGMSGDYPVAVEEGATLVRVGRAIFGERPGA